MKGYFITGTDTDVGKTLVVGSILQQLNKKGYKTLGLKPIASGGFSDALHLQRCSSIDMPYSVINPFAFELPIAPSIAAMQIGETLSVSKVIEACKPALSSSADWIIIEGAGGWQVPLNNRETMADLAKAFGFPIILVVKICLGCINHALLTYQSLLASKVPIKGWIANQCCPLTDIQSTFELDNIQIIKEFLNIPFLGVIPYNGPSRWEMDTII